MADVIVVEMENGGQLYFGPAPRGGLREVAASDTVTDIAKGRFEKTLGTLGELVKTLDREVGSLATKPSKVEMEFSASLSGDCNLWIVSGEGKAEFKVKLVWDGKGEV